jgi:hypothetical protein
MKDRPLYQEQQSIKLPSGTPAKVLKRSHGSFGWKYKIEHGVPPTTTWVLQSELDGSRRRKPAPGQTAAGAGGVA